jgi:hypothetical protein
MGEYVLFKDEDFDEATGELVGPVWIVHDESDDDAEEERGWMPRRAAKQLAADLGIPFEVDGMTDEEFDAFKKQQGLA